MASILVVGEVQPAVASVVDDLSDEGHEVRRSQDGAEAIVELGTSPVDLLISDLELPCLDGILVAKVAHNKGSDPPVILLVSERWTYAEEDRACKAGIHSVFLKSTLDSDALRSEVDRLLSRSLC